MWQMWTRRPWSSWCVRCCWSGWGEPRREAPPTHGVRAVAVPQLEVRETDRLDTGKAGDRVWTRDLFSLAEAPRLGCGLMVMEETTFPWKLTYDEMDYVVEGRLDVLVGGERISAGPGEVIHIPRGSEIQFSVKGKARFLYFVYPADWQK